MKSQFRHAGLVLLLLSALNSQLSTAYAQGSLTPPGAPVPTMKSLAQIEPRTPIASAPFIISVVGSYYLTTNITVAGGDAITITADNVTLDLNGFSVSSTEATPSGTGILLSGGRKHIHILNGHIKGNVTYSGGFFTGSGFLNGIYYSGDFPANVRVSGASVSGCQLHGINIGTTYSTVAESCTVQSVGGEGIHAARVSGSTAFICGMTGIVSTMAQNCLGDTRGSSDGVSGYSVQNCYGFCLGTGAGVHATSAANCYGQSSSGKGLVADTASSCEGINSNGGDTGLFAYYNAENCIGWSNGNGNGLGASTASNCRGISSGSGVGVSADTALNCRGSSSSGPGVSCTAAQNCYGTSDTGYGITGSFAFSCYGYSGAGIAHAFSVTKQYFCGSGPSVYP